MPEASSPSARRWPPRRRFAIWTPGVLILLAAAVLLAGWLALRGSLPPLDGRRSLAGLRDAVAIERDAHGVPTIHAGSREDAYRALGYLHAQDRFFQMDLMRRQAAGELAELFGPAVLPLDDEARRHRFRWRAAQVLANLPAEQRLWLEAYAAGVNAGLDALRTRPWEYLVLRAAPRPWSPEDTILVVDAMTMSLQEHDGLDERQRQAVLDTYGPEALAFLRPLINEKSAALDRSFLPAPAVPDAAHLTPRPAPAGAAGLPAGAAHVVVSAGDTTGGDAEVGSNAFALAGNRVAGGAAMVANDMHLGLLVPNTWYRASLVLPGRTITGVTLPGVPGIIVGSNGDVAWGFTDAYIDTNDVVIVETDPANPSRYRVPDGSGWEPMEVARETIPVAHGTPRETEIVSTRWGPLLTRRDAAGRALALRWAAYDPDAINLDLCRMEDARSVDEAIAVAHRAGLPAENFIVGDHAGNIAWTIIGRVPRRVGFDGQTPASWADGSRHWEGMLPPDDVPVVRNPADGQVWSANNRAVGGEALARLGNGGYDDDARAAQIRDRLRALAGRPAAPTDGLAVQLDDESRFLARWRDLLLDVLSDEAVDGNPALGELRAAVRAWHGHAAVDEAGHRLVRQFRQTVVEMVMNPLYEPARRLAPDLPVSRTQFRGAEQPLWSILTERPAWVLPSAATTWDALLRRAAEITARTGEHEERGLPLRDCTWGRRNVLRMRHPFSAILPGWLAEHLDMPAQALPGDSFMPRVQGPTFGASERMVVSPGHEAEGIFHQPGGASGHPLSPFYRAGHEDWANGRATPFLPGRAVYRLRLEP